MKQLSMAIVGIVLMVTNVWASKTDHVLHVALGKVSEIILPEKVAKVIKGGTPDSVLIEVIDQAVYVLPKNDQPADVYVHDVSGKSYAFHLDISDRHDVRLDLRSGVKKNEVSYQEIRPLDVMKKLLRGQEVNEERALHLEGKQYNLHQGKFQATVLRVYELEGYDAYVLKVVNQTPLMQSLNITTLSFPGLVAISSQSDVLEAHGQAGDSCAVYFVARRVRI